MKKTVDPLRGGPVVCCVETNYIISVPVMKKVLMSVLVGETEYYCHSNGVRISDTKLQRFTVPMTELNREKSYTLIYREIHSRGAYSCDLGAEQKRKFDFRPLEKSDGANIYHISDTHGIRTQAINAAGFLGENIDLLILNGDISSSSCTENEIFLQYDIAFGITKGKIPCIISRGNHDLRGKLAERLAAFIPTENGNTFYSVRLGAFWFLVLDCGEDKEDGHREYSGTVCCHSFREAETEYLRRLTESAADEYNADGVRHRIIISHVPFEYNNTELCRGERPFDIEHELYTEWCGIIRKEIRPDFMLSGHFHLHEIWDNGKNDDKNIGIPVIIGGKPINKDVKRKDYIGCAVTVNKNSADVSFNDSKHNVSEKIGITYKGEEK